MLNKEQTPVQIAQTDDRILRLQYGGKDGVRDLIHLSMARSAGLEGALEAQRFEDLLQTYPEYEQTIENRGEEFDATIGGFVIATLIARPRVEMYAHDDEGVSLSDYFPWRDKLLDRLAYIGRQEDFELIVTSRKMATVAIKELVAA